MRISKLDETIRELAGGSLDGMLLGETPEVRQARANFSGFALIAAAIMDQTERSVAQSVKQTDRLIDHQDKKWQERVDQLNDRILQLEDQLLLRGEVDVQLADGTIARGRFVTAVEVKQ